MSWDEILGHLQIVELAHKQPLLWAIRDASLRRLTEEVARLTAKVNDPMQGDRKVKTLPEEPKSPMAEAKAEAKYGERRL